MSDELNEVYIRDYVPGEPDFVAVIIDQDGDSGVATPKRYCKDCIYYKFERNLFESRLVDDKQHEQCTSPENYNDNHYAEASNPKSIPSIINRFNNCQWYDDGIDPSIDPSEGVILDPSEDEIEFYEF